MGGKYLHDVHVKVNTSLNTHLTKVHVYLEKRNVTASPFSCDNTQIARKLIDEMKLIKVQVNSFNYVMHLKLTFLLWKQLNS